jgi:putative mRNA 3-end processing factor
MLILTPKGLFCPPGNFYIDPRGAVDHAIITHAHSDHARRGAKEYYCARSGVELLRVRVGKNISVKTFEYGETFFMNQVKVSLHPAGHILGSSQVRMECNGEVWVVSGDYKRTEDPTCEPFETVTCDVFVTEATFGTPAFSWPDGKNLGQEIYEWWQSNSKMDINSVLFAYSLGKAQRVLGVLEPYASSPIYCHSAVTEMNSCYRSQNILLAETICLSEISQTKKLRGELFLVPQAFLKTPQAKILGANFETAFASGWMTNDRGFGSGYDKGFVMSDHADWKDLVRTIIESKAKRVYVQHRGAGALVRHLRTLGIFAFPEKDLNPLNPDQLPLF